MTADGRSLKNILFVVYIDGEIFACTLLLCLYTFILQMRNLFVLLPKRVLKRDLS